MKAVIAEYLIFTFQVLQTIAFHFLEKCVDRGVLILLFALSAIDKLQYFVQ